MRDTWESIFREGRKPTKFRSDKGVEYKNREVAKLLQERSIDKFFTENELKASYAERGIKTIKSRLSRYMTRHQSHRWIDVLASVTQSYNATVHRSIKMAPKNVTQKDEIRLWKMQSRTQRKKKVSKTTPRCAFRLVKTVRISKLRYVFDREYDERWTMEYFIVADRGKRQGLPYFVLKDTMGFVIQGTFQSGELSKVTITDDTVYRIEKVLRKRRGKVEPWSELSIFTPPPRNIAIQRREFIEFEYRAISQLSNCADLEFLIPPQFAGYLDLKRSTLNVKVRLHDAYDIPILKDENVGLVNLCLHSLFFQVDCYLQQTAVGQAGTNYPYKAYIDTLLSTSANDKVELESQLFIKMPLVPMILTFVGVGIPGSISEVNTQKEGRILELEGPIHSDIFQQNRLIINGVSLSLRLHQSKNAFRLMSDKSDESTHYEC
ncbi:unnamed protein product [Mytilus edulis]|uniref:Integrase catalytic domain-containing protein n=1 Tax=Mytilus edulis TaxID=6550 RepID=A0A8S3RVX2_MYTED|nr:unnamed protein product [Mytilus edulis]